MSEANLATSPSYIHTFTTRVDTIFGVTALVIAPEHPLVSELTTSAQEAEVKAYIAASQKKTDLERTDLNKQKSGVFTGSFARHPLTGEEVPVWIADYVLPNYATGAVMSVPAHDQRDLEFAQKYNLEIKTVVDPVEAKDVDANQAFVEDGLLVNSGEFDGLAGSEARTKISQFLEEKGLGARDTIYRLRDWLVSRQRYWGAPIPIIYTPKSVLDRFNQQKRAAVLTSSANSNLKSADFAEPTNHLIIDFDTIFAKKEDYGAAETLIQALLVIPNLLVGIISTTPKTWFYTKCREAGLDLSHAFYGGDTDLKREKISRMCRGWQVETSAVFYLTANFSDFSDSQTLFNPSKIIGYVLDSEPKLASEQSSSFNLVTDFTELDLILPGKKDLHLGKKSNFLKRLESWLSAKALNPLIDCAILDPNANFLVQKTSGSESWQVVSAEAKTAQLDIYHILKKQLDKSLDADLEDILYYTGFLNSEMSSGQTERLGFVVSLEDYGDVEMEAGKVSGQAWVSAEEYRNQSLNYTSLVLDEAFKFVQNRTEKTNDLSQFIDVNKPIVVTVHGGNSFESYGKYVENLRQQPLRLETKKSWKKDLKHQLPESEFQVINLEFPNANNAKYEEWKIQFDKLKPYLTTETYLIGHSLGGLFLARYLSEQKLSIKALHLVAAAGDTGDFGLPEKWDVLHQNCESIYIWHSADDQVVPLETAFVYQQNLPDAILLKYQDRGHFVGIDFPELAEMILEYEQNSWTEFDGQKYRLVIDKNLPVLLPQDVDFRPDGQSPLNYSQTFKKVICPLSGATEADGVFREKDTMDTFVCSSWYYLRYLDAHNSESMVARDRAKEWMPVDVYIGGAEHAVLHLMYARFMYKALQDGGVI